MNTTVANKLKILRKKRNWSQEEVAHRLHISQSAYGRIENGESFSWAAHLDAICVLYDVSPEELIKQDAVIINKKNKKGNNNITVISLILEKLIESFEIRLTEKENHIKQLEKKLSAKKQRI